MFTFVVFMAATVYRDYREYPGSLSATAFVAIVLLVVGFALILLDYAT